MIIMKEKKLFQIRNEKIFIKKYLKKKFVHKRRKLFLEKKFVAQI